MHACTNMQICQKNQCLQTQSMDVDKDLDQIVDL